MDELDARVRSLEAERLRPVPPPPGISGEVLAELCEVLGDEGSGALDAGVPANPLAGVADLPDDVCLCLARIESRLDLSDKVLARLRGALVCGLVGACELAEPGASVIVHGSMFAHGQRPRGEATG